MSNSSRIPSNNQEWAQVADSAKEAAACVGDTAHHAVSAIGAYGRSGRQ